MTQHPDNDRLQEYLDDLLCREERAELEAHLAACADCTAELVGQRELRRAFAALPRSIAPERDLLAGINATIDAASASPVRIPFHDRPIASLRYPLAAAALVLIALTALVTALLVRGPESPQVASGGTVQPAVRAAAADPMVREVLAMEGSYIAASRELEAALVRARATLDPATLALVDANLAVIERALAESRAALRQEPDNAALAQLLLHARAQKLELLRRATRGRT